MYVFTLLFIFGGIRYVGALRSRLFLSLSAAISQSERYTTHIFSFKPLLFYCRRPSLSLLSLRRSSSSGSSFSGSFSHERTIENSVEGGGEGAVRTLPVLANSFHSPPPYITLSLILLHSFFLLSSSRSFSVIVIIRPVLHFALWLHRVLLFAVFPRLFSSSFSSSSSSSLTSCFASLRARASSTARRGGG